MVETMEEYFGSCTNHGECEAACPKEITIDFIAQMNRDYLKSKAQEPQAASASPRSPPGGPARRGNLARHRTTAVLPTAGQQ